MGTTFFLEPSIDFLFLDYVVDQVFLGALLLLSLIICEQGAVFCGAREARLIFNQYYWVEEYQLSNQTGCIIVDTE